MTDVIFAQLAADVPVVFDPRVDRLVFPAEASAAGLSMWQSSAGLRLSSGGKTVTLAGVTAQDLPSASLAFADGSIAWLGDGETGAFRDWLGGVVQLAGAGRGHYVDAGGGADLVVTGAGNDWIIGNDALAPLTRVSQAGGTGSPSAALSPVISADGERLVFVGGWTAFGSASDQAQDVLLASWRGAVNLHRDAGGRAVAGQATGPALSGDGLWLGFDSDADLGAGQTGRQVWRVLTAGGTAQLVSASAGGAAANGASDGAALSADGRFVVFSSYATNLGPSGARASESDVFLKDMQTGAVQRLSTAAAGGDGNGQSRDVDISADGRFVAFASEATDLGPGGGAGGADIYLWDATSGSLRNLTAGLGGAGASDRPVVAHAGDGAGVVVFRSDRQLVAQDRNAHADIYARDLQSGLVTLVSAGAAGAGDGASDAAAVSADGRFVVFRSAAGNLVHGDGNGLADIFVRDLQTGTIALVSAPPGGMANGAAGGFAISAGGDWITFDSRATNLPGADGNGPGADVFRLANPLLRDTLMGGAGDDVYTLFRPDLVTEAAGGGQDIIRANFSMALPDHVEALMLTGSADISATGNAGDNLLYSNAGNNVLNGLGGQDVVSYGNARAAVQVDLQLADPQATGGAGRDQLISIEGLTGSPFDDQLTGDAGANVLHGDEGRDTLRGGGGDDFYTVGQAQDLVIEEAQAGTDTVVAHVDWVLGAHLENLILRGGATRGIGNAGHNRVEGAGNADLLEGGGGDDTLVGGFGADTMAGGAGRDRYFVDTTGDVISEAGGDGIDTVRTTVNWRLAAGFENIALFGEAAQGIGNALANRIYGGGRDDRLAGMGGRDTIIGNAGNDLISGGGGSDILGGGAGADTFVWTDPKASRAYIGRDRVLDFQPGIDRLDLSGVDASTRHTGMQDLRWAGSVPQANSVWQSFNGTNLMLNVDVSGDLRPDMQISLRGVALVSGADFLL